MRRAEYMTTRAQAFIDVLEEAGYRLLHPHEVERLKEVGVMLALYGDDCFPPPNEQGQKHFGACMMDDAAATLMGMFFPVCESAWPPPDR
jgi:hypothetical protein